MKNDLKLNIVTYDGSGKGTGWRAQDLSQNEDPQGRTICLGCTTQVGDY
ncbi:MAG: hypothetical protein ABFD92_00295 [Planctomycetaceae bacterium]